MRVRFEKATEKDKPAIWEMFVTSMKPHIELIWGWDEDWQTREFDTHFFELNTSFIVLSGEKLGYIQYSLGEKETYLNMIILKPEVQSKGFGEIVLEAIQGFQDATPLKLRCFNVNKRALKFYKENGFSEAAQEENFILLERK